MKTKGKSLHEVRIASLTFLLVAFCSHAFAQTGTWTTVAPMPTPINETSGVSFDGRFYVMSGGDFDASGNIPAPQVYDPIANAWSSLAPDPTPRLRTAVGVMNGLIYSAEGLYSDQATTALEIYNPATNTWTSGTPSLVARSETASAVIGGKLYITGGLATYGGGDYSTLEIYDPVANSWTTGAPIPVACEGAVGAAINGKFYVVGGQTRPAGGTNATPSPATTAVYIYDPATNTWTTGAPLPAPRTVASGAVIKGKLYITGGYPGYSVNGGGSTDNPVEVYDPLLNSWSADTADPAPRQTGTAVAIDGILFVAGGLVDATGPSVIETTTEAFTPASIGNEGTPGPPGPQGPVGATGPPAPRARKVLPARSAQPVRKVRLVPSAPRARPVRRARKVRRASKGRPESRARQGLPARD